MLYVTFYQTMKQAPKSKTMIREKVGFFNVSYNKTNEYKKRYKPNCNSAYFKWEYTGKKKIDIKKTKDPFYIMDMTHVLPAIHQCKVGETCDDIVANSSQFLQLENPT